MPEFPQLKYFEEPIQYCKIIMRKKILEDISFSEEVAGSIKTVYSSESDDRLDEFMSENAMIEKVSLFLSEVSFGSVSRRDMLKSSVHDHGTSFVQSNFENAVSSFVKKEIIEKKNNAVGSVGLRSMSVQPKLHVGFNYPLRAKDF